MSETEEYVQNIQDPRGPSFMKIEIRMHLKIIKYLFMYYFIYSTFFMQDNLISEDEDGIINIKNNIEHRNDVNIIWDMENLEKELKLRVYGQNDAISNLTQSLREAIYDIKNNQSNPKMFFLLGGPGVGKHLVLDIIKNHIKCHYKMNRNKPCYIEYKNHQNYLQSFDKPFVKFEMMKFHNYSENSVSFVNIRSLEFYLKSSYPHDYTLFREMIGLDVENPKCLYFITGPIISDILLEKFDDAQHYLYYVKNAAKMTHRFALLHFPVFDTIMIQFKPLDRDTVQQCLMDKKVSPTKIKDLLDTHNYTDFIPLGCKTR